MLLTINLSCIYYDENVHLIDEYRLYLVNLLHEILSNLKIPINIIIGDSIINFPNSNMIIRIKYNVEHTLVLKDGRSVDNIIVGNIETKDKNDFYLVRVCDFHNLNSADIIIDYSIPNILNIQSSSFFNNFSKKLIYISPYTFTYNPFSNKRDINIITTFINPNEKRRKSLLEKAQNENINIINVNNCFDVDELRKLLSNVKIIINIHQTDHHHTFEEFRCLSALLCGTIVISEESPLSNNIPYNDSIIWSSYDNILYRAKEVLEDYDRYYELIFANNNLKDLHKMNLEGFKDKIIHSTIMNKTLDDLARSYILDKSVSTHNHNYIPGYESLFIDIRSSVKNVLEIGIGSLENGQMGGPDGPLASLGYKTGNSLRCWRDYFHNANIYGIDIFEHNLNEERITTFKADQSSETDLLNLMSNINNNLDIIIDDGSHNETHQVFSFMTLEKYLSPNGIYVIEDIQPPFIETFKDLSLFPLEFKTYILNNYRVEIFDTRRITDRKDDFMMAFIRK